MNPCDKCTTRPSHKRRFFPLIENETRPPSNEINIVKAVSKGTAFLGTYFIYIGMHLSYNVAFPIAVYLGPTEELQLNRAKYKLKLLESLIIVSVNY